MTQDLAIRDNEPQAFALPDAATLRRELTAVATFRQVVQHELSQGSDYGVIPGTQKPTLLKPGAEKLAKLLGLADEYEVVDKAEDWDKPLFRYIIRCRLVFIRTGQLISSGLGECNSMEAKYRWRESKRRCPECSAEAIIKGKQEYGGGWVCFKKQGGCGAKYDDDDRQILSQPTGKVENEDIYSQVNTILKMAKKRALVDAALSAGRLSDVFTQDMEDIKAVPSEAGETEQQTPQSTHEPASGKETIVGSSWPIPKNLGELFTAAHKSYGLDRQGVYETLGVKGQADIADYAEAWRKIQEAK